MKFKKLLILIYKDILIIINDKAGLGYLFIMPVALVFIMVVIQDNSFKAINDFDIKVIVQNKDNDSLGNIIVDELKNSGYFKITEISDKSSSNPEELVARGQYKIGIIIPDSITYKVNKSLKRSVSLAFNNKKRNKALKPDSAIIEIFFDPITRTSYKLMLLSMLKEYNMHIENKMMLQEVKKRIPFSSADIVPENIVNYREKYASIEGALIIPNSVQHNVPAWTLFALFFIVMSLSGNMIKEKEEGGLVRLSFAPFPLYLYLISKVSTYMIVGFIQFILMMLMGMFILPLFDFPALDIGNKYFSLLLVGFVSSLAAVGYGILVGTLAKTYQQASTFGSISVVIFAAIGGVWVPVIAMPSFMRTISVISPLNWGVDAFNNILVRNLSYTDCLNQMGLLISFFLICIIFSVKKFYFSDNK